MRIIQHVAISRKAIRTDELLTREASRWARVVDYPLPDEYEGLYSPAKGLILLDPHLSPVQRRCVLAHEISHARHRDTGCKTDKWTERRADIEAARLLITPFEYAACEQLYEGNTLMIARELEVTPWLIDAYRNWLHDQPNMIIQ